jgi:hypothetical protein
VIARGERSWSKREQHRFDTRVLDAGQKLGKNPQMLVWKRRSARKALKHAVLRAL